MNDDQKHEFRQGDITPQGVEYYCPACGRRLFLPWTENQVLKVDIIHEGDPLADHGRGLLGGLDLAHPWPMPVFNTEATVAADVAVTFSLDLPGELANDAGLEVWRKYFDK